MNENTEQPLERKPSSSVFHLLQRKSSESIKNLLEGQLTKKQTPEQKDIILRTIIKKLFSSLSNDKKTQSFEKFLESRNSFLISIGEQEIIPYLQDKSLYQKNNEGFAPIEKIVSKENENAISILHLLSSENFELKELSNICDNVKTQQRIQMKSEKSSEYSLKHTRNLNNSKIRLQEFHKKYTRDIMGQEEDSDSTKTKFQHLKTVMRITIGEEFSEENVSPLFDNILQSLDAPNVRVKMESITQGTSERGNNESYV